MRRSNWLFTGKGRHAEHGTKRVNYRREDLSSNAPARLASDLNKCTGGAVYLVTSFLLEPNKKNINFGMEARAPAKLERSDHTYCDERASVEHSICRASGDQWRAVRRECSKNRAGQKGIKKG
jgi:hypothetical protein